MNKVYVIGAGHLDIEEAKKMMAIPPNVEICCVEKVEDVPLSDRLRSDYPTMEVHKFTAPPLLPSYTHLYEEKWGKGHERPYKYHR